MIQRTLLLAVVLWAVGCVPETHFRGSPYVSGGPEGCKAKCTEWGLAFGGMVALGEYSDACICKQAERPPMPEATEPVSEAEIGAALSGAAGVAMQEKRQREQTQEQPPPGTPGR